MSKRSKRDRWRDVFDALHGEGLLEFGSVIDRAIVHELLGLDVPEVATKATFDRIAMVELQTMDYCRNILLGHGKYLAGVPAGYRVLLPSENKVQVDSYMESADRKLERALKLSRNSPKDSNMPDQTEARIMMRQKGYRRDSDSETTGAPE